MTRADDHLQTLSNTHTTVREFLQVVLPDPALADSIAEQLTVRLQIELAGQMFPTAREMQQAERDAHAAELLAQVGATIAALRIGVNRVTVYRMAERNRERNHAA